MRLVMIPEAAPPRNAEIASACFDGVGVGALLALLSAFGGVDKGISSHRRK